MSEPTGNDYVYADARSFGEAFHVSAACILHAKLSWQVGNGSEASRKLASSFLERTAAGRTGGKNHVFSSELVASAFARNSHTARKDLEAAWLDVDGGTEAKIAAFAKKWLGGIDRKVVLIWNRAAAAHEKTRNTSGVLRRQLSELVADFGFFPVFVGHPFGGSRSAGDLTALWHDPEFQNDDAYRCQLWFVRHLVAAYRLVGQLGSRSGGLDGHALLGVPTVYFDDAEGDDPKQRMRAWSGKNGKGGPVPNYRCVVLADEDSSGLACMTSDNAAEVSTIVGAW